MHLDLYLVVNEKKSGISHNNKQNVTSHGETGLKETWHFKRENTYRDVWTFSMASFLVKKMELQIANQICR
jgi:hypothetical protein